MIPERDAKSIGAEYTLEEDIVGEEAIRPHLRRAADKVARRLRREGLLARSIRTKLKTGDFRSLTRQAALPRPADTANALERGAVKQLSAFDLKVPMRLVGLAAFDLCSKDAPVQGDLFTDAQLQKERRLEQTMDALRARFGDDVIKRGDG